MLKKNKGNGQNGHSSKAAEVRLQKRVLWESLTRHSNFSEPFLNVFVKFGKVLNGWNNLQTASQPGSLLTRAHTVHCVALLSARHWVSPCNRTIDRTGLYIRVSSAATKLMSLWQSSCNETCGMSLAVSSKAMLDAIGSRKSLDSSTP